MNSEEYFNCKIIYNTILNLLPTNNKYEQWGNIATIKDFILFAILPIAHSEHKSNLKYQKVLEKLCNEINEKYEIIVHPNELITKKEYLSYFKDQAGYKCEILDELVMSQLLNICPKLFNEENYITPRCCDIVMHELN